MPLRHIVILAMTYMKTGICTAGILRDGSSGRADRWVRPVKKFGSLVASDMTDTSGTVVRVGDVAELDILEHRPVDNHVEDWVTQFSRPRPRIIERLEQGDWEQFLAHHVEAHPDEVLRRRLRSLCLIHPGEVTVEIRDSAGNDLRVRLWFKVNGEQFQCQVGNAATVTDLEFRALAREWLRDVPPRGNVRTMQLDSVGVTERLECTDLFLSFGWSRDFKGEFWPLIVGVHPLPRRPVVVDYRNP